tara:strand:+ start:11311 stop:11598 length:288 start_codon:yes stop_codon:yes gene_type:complete
MTDNNDSDFQLLSIMHSSESEGPIYVKFSPSTRRVRIDMLFNDNTLDMHISEFLMAAGSVLMADGSFSDAEMLYAAAEDRMLALEDMERDQEEEA